MDSLRHTKASWPITLDELIERRDQCARVESRWMIGFLVLFFGFLFANIPLSKWLDGDGAPEWLGTVWLFVFLAIMIGNVPLLYRSLNQRLSSFDLVCPNCEKELNHKTMPIVVATGHCCQCGAELVYDHPAKGGS